MLRALVLVVAFFAAPLWAAGTDDLLEPEKAFRLSARALDPTVVEVEFRIADGYYMYRDKFRFAVAGGDAKLGEPQFPPGQRKKDEFFGDVETYRKQVAVRLPVTSNAEKLRLEVTSQGCADVGVCYLPQVQKVDVRLAGLSLGSAERSPPRRRMPHRRSVGREVRAPAIISDESRVEQALLSGGFLLTLAVFFGAGLLLTFTPCVLPMIPILSGIIVGEGTGRRARRTRSRCR